jgi:hypothetical protein
MRKFNLFEEAFTESDVKQLKEVNIAGLGNYEVYGELVSLNNKVETSTVTDTDKHAVKVAILNAVTTLNTNALNQKVAGLTIKELSTSTKSPLALTSNMGEDYEKFAKLRENAPLPLQTSMVHYKKDKEEPSYFFVDSPITNPSEIAVFNTGQHTLIKTEAQIKADLSSISNTDELPGISKENGIYKVEITASDKLMTYGLNSLLPNSNSTLTVKTVDVELPEDGNNKWTSHTSQLATIYRQIAGYAKDTSE